MKKGFTLIELLAVIVILAIIALIATPIVLNIIEDTKESAILRSADFYLDGLEQAIVMSVLNIEIQDGTYSIMQDGNICIGKLSNNTNTCDGNILKVEMDGEVPKGGTIKIERGKISNTDLIISNKNVWTNPETGKIEIKDVEPEVLMPAGLYDENDELIKTWEELDEIAQNRYGMSFTEIVENGGDNGYDEGIAASVTNSVAGASKLVLSDNVTKIGDNAFVLANFSNIILPNTIISIGDGAFYYSNIESIEIPDSVTSIGSSVFEDTGITSVTIGSGVTSVGNYNFHQCYSLESIVVDPKNKVYKSEGNAIIEIATNTLIEGIDTIPYGVEIIGENAFFERWLNTITIPNSVKRIETSAFEMNSFKTITIPESVIYISGAAFIYCDDLETIYYKGPATDEYNWGAEYATVIRD